MGLQAAEIAIAVWRGLGCRDAGRVDLRRDASGRLNFLEVNPLAGLHPVDSDLVIPRASADAVMVGSGTLHQTAPEHLRRAFGMNDLITMSVFGAVRKP